VPEIYKYSSNIGTIRVMQAMGKDNYRAFLTRMGLDTRVPFELPEMRLPNVPKNLSDISAATMSFGHGLSVSPLHMAVAMAAIANGGNYIAPTLYRRSLEEAQTEYVRVLKPETSRDMRYLMRLNALEGSGSQTEKVAKGYRIGGKTGTAEKVENGVYSHSKDFNVFASVFPMDDPQYAMVVVVDEPHPENAQSGDTAGFNAGMMSGRIVQRVAPMLGIAPNFSQALDDAMAPPNLIR
jgi:cell division protein FtsI (penicillin-binding protein 3)